MNGGVIWVTGIVDGAGAVEKDARKKATRYRAAVIVNRCITDKYAIVRAGNGRR